MSSDSHLFSNYAPSTFVDMHNQGSEVDLERNRQRCTISWQFTSNDARSKLHHVYLEITTNKHWPEV